MVTFRHSTLVGPPKKIFTILLLLTSFKLQYLICIFSNNSNQYFAFRRTHFAYTPQGNFKILTSEIAHFPTETGSGGSRIEPCLLMKCLWAFSIDSNGTLDEETIEKQIAGYKISYQSIKSRWLILWFNICFSKRRGR